MKKDSCTELRKNLVLYALEELVGEEKKLFESHIQKCHACQREYQETRNFVAAMHDEPAPTLAQNSWDNLVRQAFDTWRQPDSKTSIISQLLSWFQPVNKAYGISLATIVLTCVVVLLITLPSSQPDYNSQSFHAQYSATQGAPVELSFSAESLLENNYNLSFSMLENSNAFVIGENYAQAVQACLYRFETLCETQIAALNQLLDNFAYLDQSIKQKRNSFIVFSDNKQSILDQLQTIDQQLNADLAVVEAGQLLYQFGSWSHDMTFAVINQIEAVRHEKDTIEFLSNQAVQLNMAKGVISSLAKMKSTLDLEILGQAEYQSLIDDLNRIKQIFR